MHKQLPRVGSASRYCFANYHGVLHWSHKHTACAAERERESQWSKHLPVIGKAPRILRDLVVESQDALVVEDELVRMLDGGIEADLTQQKPLGTYDVAPNLPVLVARQHQRRLGRL
jgi:hypothetical protein